jgi:radical SAM protein with 4Fe4S-binding SPASM domain
MEMAGVGMLAIAGGEPLLRSDFFTVADYASGKGIKVSMTTNGLCITEEVARRLDSLGLSSISVSLDGMEKSHDTVRGKGTWNRVVQNIELLRTFCHSAKIGIRCTVNGLNLQEYEPLIRLAEKLGVDVVKFNPIRCFGRATQHKNLLITEQQYVQFLTSVQKVKTNTRISLPKTPLDHCEYEFTDLGFGCTGGKETCNITPTGEFSGCAFLGDQFVVGNIKTTPLLDLWEKTQKSVQCQGNRTCTSCSKYNQCRAGCRSRALVEYGNINGIDPLCTIGKAVDGEKLTIRGEGGVYVVYDQAQEAYSKFTTFSQIEDKYPSLVQNQQFRLVSNPCALPLKVFFDVTNGCNSRCIHCYNDSRTPFDDEMTREEITKLANQMYELGIHQVSIAGGEPFFRKDIIDILQTFRDFDISVSITTNGLLLSEQMVKKITACHLKSLTISIDGVTREQYREIRGVDGFAQLNENIQTVHKFFPGEVSMRSSIMRGNADPHMVVDYAVANGFSSLKINKAHLLGRFVSHPEFCISDEEYDQCIHGFADLQKTSPITIELPREKYLSKTTSLPCTAGKSTISISPRGEVFPCAFGPRSFFFGSLREKPLIEILLNHQSFSVDNPFCQTCPGMKRSHNITRTSLIN